METSKLTHSILSTSDLTDLKKKSSVMVQNLLLCNTNANIAKTQRCLDIKNHCTSNPEHSNPTYCYEKISDAGDPYSN